MATKTAKQPLKKSITPAATIHVGEADVQQVHVRYDASCDSWAVVDATGKPVKHFTHGVLADVTFETLSVEELVRVGCGSETRYGSIGVATGTLYEGTHGKDFSGFHNMGFNGQAFVNEDGEPLSSARKLRLMPGRKALYKV